MLAPLCAEAQQLCHTREDAHLANYVYGAFQARSFEELAEHISVINNVHKTLPEASKEHKMEQSNGWGTVSL